MKRRRRENLVRFPLAEMLATAGLSASDLGRMAGMQRSNVSAILHGRSDPRWSTLARLLAALRVQAIVFDPDDYQRIDQTVINVKRGPESNGVKGREPYTPPRLYDLADRPKRGRPRKGGEA